MKEWLHGKRGGSLAFFAICVLVAGGLGWATRAALRLEKEQLAQQAQTEHAERLRAALWQLDSRIGAILIREDSRPFSHYSAIFAPPLALDGRGTPVPPGSVLEPSPLLHTELPPWMLLHFQTDERGWESPQVLSATLRRWLSARPAQVSLANVTTARQHLLQDLTRELPPVELLRYARRYTRDITVRDRVLLARLQVEQNIANTSQEWREQENSVRDYFSRSGEQSKLTYNRRSKEQQVSKDVAVLNFYRNGEEWLHNFQPSLQLGNNSLNPWSLQYEALAQRPIRLLRVPVSSEVAVSMSPMVGLWLPTTTGRQRLLALRLVRVEEKEVCQGIVLDGEQLQGLLAEEVQNHFPGARVQPAGEPAPELLAQSMTALPLLLDPGPPPVPEGPGWTALRIGLSLAWAAALVALVAVGLGGNSLLDLSARRIRFVSAVTHELRTPLTTLRLYLDLLSGGLIRDEAQRQEYLQTLVRETDRLSRLVSNVLDYSRLESQRPRLTRSVVPAAEVLAQVEGAWRGRCEAAGKTLQTEDSSGGALVESDVALLGQVLGNLLDNACKYSRDASDQHVWLRARCEGGAIHFEVEDRGPGVPVRERRLIFRPFRRGGTTDAVTGGVGLGLALAQQWTGLLGGRLLLHAPPAGGACFRVVLPVAAPAP